MEKKERMEYSKPIILDHQYIKFETKISGGGPGPTPNPDPVSKVWGFQKQPGGFYKKTLIDD